MAASNPAPPNTITPLKFFKGDDVDLSGTSRNKDFRPKQVPIEQAAEAVPAAAKQAPKPRKPRAKKPADVTDSGMAPGVGKA